MNKCLFNLESDNSYLRTPSDVLIQRDVQWHLLSASLIALMINITCYTNRMCDGVIHLSLIFETLYCITFKITYIQILSSERDGNLLRKCFNIIWKVFISLKKGKGWSQWPHSLMHGSAAACSLACGFESRQGHLCLLLVSVVCCQVWNVIALPLPLPGTWL
jgi:hypothetical protein